MTKIVLALFITVATLVVLLAPMKAMAAYNPFGQACSGSSTGAVCSNTVSGDPLTGPNGVILKVTRLIAIFTGVCAVIIMIIGGFMYVLSGGDSGKVSTAKDTILYAAVGLIVVAVAESIIKLVVSGL